MNQLSLELETIFKEHFEAEGIQQVDLIQNLWSDYGKLLRVHLIQGNVDSIIVKLIDTKSVNHHPRGWNTDIGHQRKLKSYEIEAFWYQNWASLTNPACQVPKALFCSIKEDRQLIVLEDLNTSGYELRRTNLAMNEVKLGLNWLANFHAVFMLKEPKGLWEIGTYWHLDTRPDEFRRMEDGPLKKHAERIDERLNSCRYKTVVHGDAKVANFCFNKDMNELAAVDFQYVGGGCGMKDVIYFMSSCLTETACEAHESEILDYYFKELKRALGNSDNDINFNELEKEWRELYCFAWADFLRFLLGWAPEHYKVNGYSLSMVNQALSKLD